MVALRRFFPFGAGGGGMEGDVRTAYGMAIRRLGEMRHPGMRTVIGGGCDPVDGIPYIVTEWIEGEVLAEALARGGPLDGAAAAELLARALEVCAVLSEVFADERIWVETAPDTIIWDHGASERGFTFWLAPLRWLGSAAPQPQPQGLGPVLELAEEVLGWRGRVVGDQAAGGLGSWVNWLRAQGRTATLAEARDMLAAALGGQAPSSVEVLVGQAIATAPSIELSRPSSGRLPWILNGAAALVVVAAGWWMLQRPAAPAASDDSPAGESGALVAAAGGAPESSPPRQSAEAARASALAERIGLERSAAMEREAAEREALLAAVTARGGAYGPDDAILLLEQNRSEVVFEGLLVRTRLSSSGATQYFEFSEKVTPAEPRGFLRTKDAGPEWDDGAFASFVGKVVRLKGQVRVVSSQGVRRPEILLADMASIELVK